MITNKYKLDELCEFINGGSWTQSEYDTVGVKVVQVTNLANGTVNTENLKVLSNNSYEKYKKHELKEIDLVIATVGSHPTQPNSAVGRASSIPKSVEGYLLNQNAVCIRSTSRNLDQKYLVYLGKSELMKNYIAAHARGTANQVRMPITALKSFTFMFPNIDKQKKIANILSAYDDLIENNTKRISLLEETAETIYKEWFVKFRFLGYDKCEFTNGIPKEWVVKKVIDDFDFIKGIEPGSDKYLLEPAIGTVKMLRVGNLSSRAGNIYLYKEFAKDKIAEIDDVLITLDGTIGMVKFGLEGAYSSGIRKVVAKEAYIGRMFTYCLMKSDNIQSTINAYAKGSTIIHAGSSIQYMEYIQPSLDILKKYNTISENIFKKILVLQVANAKLKETRDILIEKLVRGEIEV